MADETTEPTIPVTESEAPAETPPETPAETPAEPEPEPAHEVPLVCGHWVSTYESEGKDYCGVCGVLIS